MEVNVGPASRPEILAKKTKKVKRGDDFPNALQEGDPVAVWNLLESDADPESVFAFGNPPMYYRPLHLAIAWHRNAIVELLIAYNADANAKEGESQRTPLHYAVTVYNKIGLKILLDNGADHSLQNRNL